MTLTTHAITGAAIASVFPQNPTLAFGLAFASHFVLDVIPHWDYEISSESIKLKSKEKFKFDRKFFADLLKIGADGCLGIASSLLIFAKPGLFIPVLIGVMGALLPDLLQFAYIFFKPRLLEVLVHIQNLDSNHKLKKRPFWGITIQLAIILTAVACFKYLT